MRYLFTKGFSEKELRAIGEGNIPTGDELRLWLERVLTVNMDAVLEQAKGPSRIKVKVKK